MVLRILQGFSAGGKWGGAALMAVQHAPRGERGFWGAYSQFGVPVGMILATLVLFLLRLSMSPEQFLEWGWRVPFLLSVALIVVSFIGVSMVKETKDAPLAATAADDAKVAEPSVSQGFAPAAGPGVDQGPAAVAFSAREPQ